MNYKQVTEDERYQIYVMKKAVGQAIDLALVADTMVATAGDRGQAF